MDAPAAHAVPRDLPPLERAVRLAGSQEKLAELTGYKQSAIAQAKRRGRVSAKLAIKIDAALAPEVTKSDLLPDLFPPEKAVA